MARVLRYVTTDAMGSVTSVLSSTGEVLERRSYDAFGKMTCMLPDGTPVATSPTGLKVGFHGQLLDQFTGMYQMGYRWYSPVLGRWVSRDPIELDGGANWLAFVANSPVQKRDPLGLVNCEDPCGEAARLGLFEQQDAMGLTICCNGIKHPCAAPESQLAKDFKGTIPAEVLPIHKECTVAHESYHASDSRTQCDPQKSCIHVAGVTAGSYVWNNTEYRAYLTQVECLKKSLAKCETAQCKLAVERLIRYYGELAEKHRSKSGMPPR